MRKLVLVRHSKPEIAPDRPASSWRLGDAGRRRSELLASGLLGLNASTVWSSREPKAVETAEIVARALGVPVRTAGGLEEHHRDGVPYLPQLERFEGAVEGLFHSPDRLVFGTETAEQALRRFTAAVDRVIEEERSDSIVVTHGTVMALYVARVAGVEPAELWRRLDTPSFVVLTLPDLDVHSIMESVAER